MDAVAQVPAAIRKAQVADIPAIQIVARTAWAAAYAGLIPEEIQRQLLDTWYSAAALKQALGARESMFLVAERESVVVGFAQYMERSAELVELTRIYVMPPHQHAGIGTRLVEAGLAAFGQQGVERLTVAVEQENALGRSFYRRMGFAEVCEFSRNVHGFELRLIECQRNVADDVRPPS